MAMQKVNLNFRKEEDFRAKEAFKTLRSNIEFCGDDVKVICVTSCTPNEGKSSVAVELAKSFANSGKKTILVDADMRKSVLVGRYRTGAVKNGLSHLLIGKYKIEDVIHMTNVPNYYAIFSGPVPPNPSELLGSARFTKLLEILKKHFDYVIIDTPPLGSVIDSAIVGSKSDGVALVVEGNAISYKFAQNVKDQLDKAGCRILGVILNKINMSSKGYYGRYYGKYYGKYYGNYGQESSDAYEEEEEKTVSVYDNEDVEESIRREQVEEENVQYDAEADIEYIDISNNEEQ